MKTAKEHETFDNDLSGRFRNVPHVSMAVTLLVIIALAAMHRIPYPFLVIPGAVLIFFIFVARYWFYRVHLTAKRQSTRLILGGLVFLAGALYGVIEVALGQVDKLDLLALIIPALLGGWSLRQGLKLERKQNDRQAA